MTLPRSIKESLLVVWFAFLYVALTCFFLALKVAALFVAVWLALRILAR